jgi:hypothetical protein
MKTLKPWVRRDAATRNQSMTSVMAEAIRTLVDEHEQTAKAKLRFLERVRNAPDRKTGGTTEAPASTRKPSGC